VPGETVAHHNVIGAYLARGNRSNQIVSGDAQLLLQLLYEPHVDNGVISDGFLKDIGLAHHRLTGCPGLRRDETIGAEYLIGEGAIECRFKVLL
jgi:hypothetical protein